MSNRYGYLDHGGVLAFAHRGGTSAWPENTLPAFQHAIDLGYLYLETDVHASSDGVLFAFHDDNLARVSDSDASISELTAAEVDGVRVLDKDGDRPPQRVPRLDEVIASWPYLRFNIDPKSDAAVEPLVATLRRPGLVDRVCIGSFSDRRIKFCRQAIGPDLCTSMGPWEGWRFRAASYGLPVRTPFDAGCIQTPRRAFGHELVDSRLVEAGHRLDVDVHVWTINTEPDMHALLDLGVSGLMTDEPEVLRTVLIKRNEWKDYCLD